jgi:hypothetical protein
LKKLKLDENIPAGVGEIGTLVLRCGPSLMNEI